MSDPDHSRPIRVINPLGMRVLVRLIAPDQRSGAGLYLPKTVEPRAEDASYGEVIEVARTQPEGSEFEGDNVSGIPAGSHVLFAPEAGFSVPWDDSLRLVETKAVLAVVEEIEANAAH